LRGNDSKILTRLQNFPGLDQQLDTRLAHSSFILHCRINGTGVILAAA
jgi:hypothetical protein